VIIDVVVAGYRPAPMKKISLQQNWATTQPPMHLCAIFLHLYCTLVKRHYSYSLSVVYTQDNCVTEFHFKSNSSSSKRD